VLLEQRLSIYVYRVVRDVPEYLVVRPRPRVEFPWSPIGATLQPSDTLETATLHRMREGFRAPLPSRWIDLELCDHFAVGDLGLVDWAVGYGVAGAWEPAEDPTLEEVRWRPLLSAFRLFETESSRRALLRLHLIASSAFPG
jgi:hypothetical protein